MYGIGWNICVKYNISYKSVTAKLVNIKKSNNKIFDKLLSICCLCIYLSIQQSVIVVKVILYHLQQILFMLFFLHWAGVHPSLSRNNFMKLLCDMYPDISEMPMIVSSGCSIIFFFA